MSTTRTYRRALALWLLAAAALTAALAAALWLDSESHRGISYGLPERRMRFAEVPQGGVNAYFLHLEPDPEAITRTFDLIDAAGITYVRVQFPWEDIEIHGKGDYEDRRHEPHRSAWEKYDRIVNAAHERGLQLIIRLDRPPEWARQASITDPDLGQRLAEDPEASGPPDTLADYGDFVGQVVGRYGDKVRFFQLWNEPNYRREWNYRDPSAAEFTQLLCEGYRRATAASPQAVIVGPSLAPADGKHWLVQSDLEFLDQLYQAGAADCFDIFSAQLYGLGQPPDEHRFIRVGRHLDRPIDTRTDVSRVVLLREIMERHGDHATAVWVSEFGWNSAPFPTEWGASVSEEQKASHITGLMRRARQEWPWMGAMNVWFLRYGGYAEPDPANPTPYFALVSRDWQLLPAYTELQRYLTEEQTLGLGTHPITQSGTLRFWGDLAALELGSDTAISVTVDGQHTSVLDGSGRITFDQLDLGEHTLQIEVSGDPATLLVGRRPPGPWRWMVPALLLAGLAGALWRVLLLLGRGR